jgi:hypothetical protein
VCTCKVYITISTPTNKGCPQCTVAYQIRSCLPTVSTPYTYIHTYIHTVKPILKPASKHAPTPQPYQTQPPSIHPPSDTPPAQQSKQSHSFIPVQQKKKKDAAFPTPTQTEFPYLSSPPTLASFGTSAIRDRDKRTTPFAFCDSPLLPQSPCSCKSF